GIIDKKINFNYKLWKTNYMAYDILYSTNEFANMYSSAEKDEFLNYISFKMQSVEEGMEEVEQILLSIYANPVVTRKNMNL
ncbi:MAG: glycerol acyltransferase, partial [Bacteroidales bacterium]|nr:glycerol acyltransferase [Bacteroidales bacterium]